MNFLIAFPVTAESVELTVRLASVVKSSVMIAPIVSNSNTVVTAAGLTISLHPNLSIRVRFVAEITGS